VKQSFEPQHCTPRPIQRLYTIRLLLPTIPYPLAIPMVPCVFSYKQTRYNLLREQSEGYSKLVTELYQSVGSAHDASTGQPVETRARLVQRAQETWTRVVALVGVFDLDPNRAVDIFLDCFETHLTSHWAFFLELLRCSPWSRSKPHGSDGLQETADEQTMDVDAEPDWEGLTMDEVLIKAEGIPFEMAEDPFTPQGSQCGQILGFKFAYYQVSVVVLRIRNPLFTRTQSSSVPENAPSRLYMLAALLLREGFIKMDDLYPHVCSNFVLFLHTLTYLSC
jgi:THO complex subunit 2